MVDSPDPACCSLFGLWTNDNDLYVRILRKDQAVTRKITLCVSLNMREASQADLLELGYGSVKLLGSLHFFKQQ